MYIGNKRKTTMARIPDTEVQRLKDEIAVQRLIEDSGVALKKTGKDLAGRCPFHEDGTIARYTKDSYDRKPKPGMLIRAMTDFPVIKERSFLIGDKQADLEAAQAAGVRGFLFSGGNLSQFADWALADMGEPR